MESYGINYKEIFQDAIKVWGENNYNPIHLDKNFINTIRKFRISII